MRGENKNGGKLKERGGNNWDYLLSICIKGRKIKRGGQSHRKVEPDSIPGEQSDTALHFACEAKRFQAKWRLCNANPFPNWPLRHHLTNHKGFSRIVRFIYSPGCIFGTFLIYLEKASCRLDNSCPVPRLWLPPEREDAVRFRIKPYQQRSWDSTMNSSDFNVRSECRQES